MTPIYIDAHCHLADPKITSFLDRIILEAAEANVCRFIQGGIDPNDWQRQRELATRYPNEILPVFGIHPWRVLEETIEKLEGWFELLQQECRQICAIGEIGLDFYRAKDRAQQRLQQEIFQRQLDLALSWNKPIVIHSVKAHNEVVTALRQTAKGDWPRGIIHGFSGSTHSARKYLDVGLAIGVGPLLLKRSRCDLFRFIPTESLVLESDAPNHIWKDTDGYGLALSPQKQVALPQVIVRIAAEASAIKGLRTDALLAEATNNCTAIFGLKPGPKGPGIVWERI